jgi:hypothetical protein
MVVSIPTVEITTIFGENKKITPAGPTNEGYKNLLQN